MQHNATSTYITKYHQHIVVGAGTWCFEVVWNAYSLRTCLSWNCWNGSGAVRPPSWRTTPAFCSQTNGNLGVLGTWVPPSFSSTSSIRTFSLKIKNIKLFQWASNGSSGVSLISSFHHLVHPYKSSFQYISLAFDKELLKMIVHNIIQILTKNIYVFILYVLLIAKKLECNYSISLQFFFEVCG